MESLRGGIARLLAAAGAVIAGLALAIASQVTSVVAGPVPGPPVAPVPYRWPLSGTPRIVARFDPPAEPWLPGQRGVILATVPGAAVYPAAAGTVHFAGQVGGVGVVSVDHPGGLRTTYEPVRVLVRAGQRVGAGTVIGRVLPGLAGCPAGVAACLHWGLLRGGVYLDPLSLFGDGAVRLLPDRAVGRPTVVGRRGQGSDASTLGRPPARRS